MITNIIILSLQITAIYVCFTQGMIFGEVRIYLLQKTFPEFKAIWKPIFDCLICMGGVWSLVLGKLEFNLPLKELIFTMVAVIGLNTLIDFFISKNIE
jgi:hypothetical protein